MDIRDVFPDVTADIQQYLYTQRFPGIASTERRYSEQQLKANMQRKYPGIFSDIQSQRKALMDIGRNGDMGAILYLIRYTIENVNYESVIRGYASPPEEVILYDFMALGRGIGISGNKEIIDRLYRNLVTDAEFGAKQLIMREILHGALEAAAELGDLDMVKYMIDKYRNMIDNPLYYVLFGAGKGNSRNIVEWVESVNWGSLRFGIPWIELAYGAAYSGNLDLIIYVFTEAIQRNNGFYIESNDYDSLARIAAEHGHRNILDWLFNNVDVEFINWGNINEILGQEVYQLW